MVWGGSVATHRPTRRQVLRPITAPMSTTTRTHKRPWTSVNATVSGASLSSLSDCTMPHSTRQTAPYSTAQMPSASRMPRGRSRCGFAHSSAALLTASKPTYAKNTVAAVEKTTGTPWGAKGVRWDESTCGLPATMTTAMVILFGLARRTARSAPDFRASKMDSAVFLPRTMRIFVSVRMLFMAEVSRMPRQSTAVIPRRISGAKMEMETAGHAGTVQVQLSFWPCAWETQPRSKSSREK